VTKLHRPVYFSGYSNHIESDITVFTALKWPEKN